MSALNNNAMTDAELEAQFVERNSNLKKTMHNLVDKIESNVPSTGLLGQTSTTAVDNTAPTTTTTMGQPSNILEQTNKASGINVMDEKLMNSIKTDVNAMHSSNPEKFEGVANKMDETFGNNALI